MISCVSFGPGFFIMLLAPLGLSYLICCYEVMMLICDKKMTVHGVIARAVPVFIISGIYLSLIGGADSTAALIALIPILISTLSISITFINERTLQN